MSFVRFARIDDIPPGRSRSVRIGLRHIAVFHLEGRLHAIEDSCGHMKAPLSGGRVRGTEVTCARHGWVYDIPTGRRCGKEEGRIRTFPVKVEDGMIYVDPDVQDATRGCDGEGGEADDDTAIPPPVP